MTPAELHSLIQSLGKGGQSLLARRFPCNVRTIRRMLKGETRIRPHVADRLHKVTAQIIAGRNARKTS